MTLGLKRWLPVLALLMVMAAAAALSIAVNAGSMTEVKRLSVTGELSVSQRNTVFNIIGNQQLLDTPIADLQQKLEMESWIQSATVERSWPDTVVVTVAPEHPIALWNDDAYLNDEGQVFRSPFVNRARLPQLYGPIGKEFIVTTQFQQLNNTLFKVGQYIEMLTLGPRDNWSFQSDVGIEVLLGKSALMERVQRLLTVTEYIEQSGKLDQIEQIDTRYGNGVAVAWKEQSGTNLSTNYNSQRDAKL
ncbi:MAG: cell division protein FtsQ [Candidatus Azotimanducaceae bacterium]|jgi:cell division protein FtsQ